MVTGVCPAYLPNIHYMAWVVSQRQVTMVTNNPYQKQTYRNRTEIYGANGKLKLTIPIVHTKNKDRQIDVNNKEANYTFIQDFVINHIDGIKLKKGTSSLECTTCKLKHSQKK